MTGSRRQWQLRQRWVIEVTGAASMLFAGETYKLQVDFPEHCPMESPHVIFLNPALIHPHIYSTALECVNMRGYMEAEYEGSPLHL